VEIGEVWRGLATAGVSCYHFGGGIKRPVVFQSIHHHEECDVMPLFQYSCKACGQESEVLVRGAARPTCPACGSPKLVKLASHFAALSGTSRGPACMSGGCDMGAGPCQMGGGCCLN
jgi:putative FmdB family regulatory protein